MSNKDEALRQTLIFLLACHYGSKPTKEQFKSMANLCGGALPMKYRLTKQEFEVLKRYEVLR